MWKPEVPCLYRFVLTKLRRGDSSRFFNISLHFFEFNFILCSIENLWISLTATFSKLIPFLGRISNAVVSSTNLILKCQSRKRLLVITANKITPSFVPCGIPLLGDFQSDREFPILTACDLPVRKALIQLIKTVLISKDINSLRRIEWSIRSKPFE